MTAKFEPRHLVPLGLLLLLPACNKDPERIDQFFNDLADAYCSYLYRCCDTHELEYFKTKFTSQDGCKQITKLSFRATSYAYQLAAEEGSLGANGGAMDGCISAINSMTCGKFTQITSPLQNTIDSCKVTDLLVGQRDAKEECFTSLDCTPGNYCSNSSSNAWVCVPLRGVDDPCDISSECNTGLGCATPQNAINTCRPLAKVGESCQEIDCDTTSNVYVYCDQTSHTCTNKKADGESCTANQECQSGSCQGGGTNGKCATLASNCDGQ